MLIIDRDGSIVKPKPGEPLTLQRAYVEMVAQPGDNLSQSIEQLLEIAFDQFHLYILDLRIRQANP